MNKTVGKEPKNLIMLFIEIDLINFIQLNI